MSRDGRKQKSSLILIFFWLFNSVYSQEVYNVNVQRAGEQMPRSTISIQNPSLNLSKVNFELGDTTYSIADSQMCARGTSAFDHYKLCRPLIKNYIFRSYSFEDSLTYFVSEKMVAKGLFIDKIHSNLFSHSDKYEFLTISGNELDNISIENDTIGRLFLSCAPQSFDLVNCYIKVLEFSNFFTQHLGIGSSLPDSLIFIGAKLNDKQPVLDLTAFRNPSRKETVLTVQPNDLYKIKFNYLNYKLDFKSYEDSSEANVDYEKDRKLTTYTILIELQEKYGFTDGKEKATKEYKAFNYTKDGKIVGYTINWIDKTWWDYGYNKSLIFRNTFYLMLLFYFFNLLMYDKLLRNTYPIEEFIINDVRTGKLSFVKSNSVVKPSFKNKLQNAVYCLFYTGYVFLGFKLDFKILKLQNLWLATYIIFQSVVGLICLAYMVNYIITK